jgi:hypothetical protein
MTIETLKAHRNDPEAPAELLTPEDIAFLVPLLSEKDDEVRYPAFLLLCARSRKYPDVYPYWDVFAQKLGSENSYQRDIGAILIGHNVRWDDRKLFPAVFQKVMRLCMDEKPSTARLTLQTIPGWAKYVPELMDETAAILTGIDIMSFRETMRKTILTDIVNALLAIREVKPTDEITAYLMRALTGGILDKKTARQFEARMK